MEIELDEFTTGFYHADDDIIEIKISEFESLDDNFVEMVVHEVYHAINKRRSGGKVSSDMTNIGSNEHSEEIAARGWSTYRQLAMKLSDENIIAGLRNPESLKGKSELFDQYLQKDGGLLKKFLKSVYRAMRDE